jgi:hypothetical protein
MRIKVLMTKADGYERWIVLIEILLVQLACHPFINWKGMKIHSEQKKKECRMM